MNFTGDRVCGSQSLAQATPPLTQLAGTHREPHWFDFNLHVRRNEKIPSRTCLCLGVAQQTPLNPSHVHSAVLTLPSHRPARDTHSFLREQQIALPQVGDLTVNLSRWILSVPLQLLYSGNVNMQKSSVRESAATALQHSISQTRLVATIHASGVTVS